MPYGSLQAGLGKGLGRVSDIIRWVFEQKEAQKQQDIENQLAQQRMALMQRQQTEDEGRRAGQEAFERATWTATNAPEGFQLGEGGKDLFAQAGLADWVGPKATSSALPSRTMTQVTPFAGGESPSLPMIMQDRPGREEGMYPLLPTQSRQERVELIRGQYRQQADALKNSIAQQRLDLSQKVAAFNMKVKDAQLKGMTPYQQAQLAQEWAVIKQADQRIAESQYYHDQLLKQMTFNAQLGNARQALDPMESFRYDTLGVTPPTLPTPPQFTPRPTTAPQQPGKIISMRPQ